jgi:hypothetical protein
VLNLTMSLIGINRYDSPYGGDIIAYLDECSHTSS